MNDLYELSYSYYRAFYSYREHVGLLSPSTLIVSLTFMAFAAAVICLFFGGQEPVGILSEGARLLIVLAAEIIFIASWMRVNGLKEQNAKRSASAALGEDFVHLCDAKKAWLESNIGTPRYEYFELANQLSQSLDLRKKHRSNLASFAGLIPRLIYDPGSKPRIISLVIFGLSVTTLIMLRTGLCDHEIIDSVFVLFRSSAAWIILVLASLVTWFAFVTIVFSRAFVLDLLSSLSLWVERKKSRSRANADRFIEALVDNAAIPRNKCSVALHTDPI